MATTTNRTDKVLVVDDDARIRDLLRRYLTQEGFEVMVAEDGKALNRLLLRETVDIIVLDLMMPGEDGLSICRRLRAANDRTPIIMLTAKGEDVDRIVGLEVGADDYLGKPFNPRELLARVHAVLRRRPAQEAPGAPSSDNEVVTFGPFAFDLGARTQAAADGQAVFARHHQVQHDQVHGVAQQDAVQRLAVFRHHDLEAFLGQVTAQQVADAGVVVNDQNLVSALGGLCHGCPV